MKIKVLLLAGLITIASAGSESVFRGVFRKKGYVTKQEVLAMIEEAQRDPEALKKMIREIYGKQGESIERRLIITETYINDTPNRDHILRVLCHTFAWHLTVPASEPYVGDSVSAKLAISALVSIILNLAGI